ncbi:MAG: amidohydrolase family protein [Verrucomicrobia bacterium]|nr:MAG: amidohydrolase family protein [Verrucomicrobiota bacterium]
MHSIIDSHVHLYPEEVNKDPIQWAEVNQEKQWKILCTKKRRDNSPVQLFPTVSELLKAMDDACVERSVLMGWYWETESSCEMQNAFYKSLINSHADRFSAFASVHPKTKQIKSLIKKLKDDGFSGLGELSPHSQGVAIREKSLSEILTAASELAMPVNLHVSDPDSRRYEGYVETPLKDFIALAKRFPKTRFILAHLGGLLPVKYPEVRDLENIYYDTAALPLLYESALWPLFLSHVDSSKILYGSDYPLRLYPSKTVKTGVSDFIQALESSCPSEITRAALLAGNIKAILKL